MDRHGPGLRWYAQSGYEYARDCTELVIPQCLQAIEGFKSRLRVASNPAAAQRLAVRIQEQLAEITTAYHDIQVALQSSNDTHRWSSFPGLPSLVQEVSAVTWDDLDHAPGGPYWFSMPTPSFTTFGTRRHTLAPQPASLAGEPSAMAPPTLPDSVDREGGAAYFDPQSSTSFAPAPSPVLDQPAPIGVNRRKTRNDASSAPSVATPSLKHWFPVIARPTVSDHGDSGIGSNPQHNGAPDGQQCFLISLETMAYMEHMRLTLENYMKGVFKDAFDSSELHPIYTRAFKDRCFDAIQRGDFVPLESFMCYTGEKDLCKKTLPEALMDCRKSRQATSARAISVGQRESSADNIHRNRCIQLLARAMEKGEAFPLDKCWCGNEPHCLLGPAALNHEEVVTYQWMAANDYVCFGEIPMEALAGMDKLTDEALGSVFTTWKVELRDDGVESRKSAWSVSIVSRTLKELYEERLYDAARERGIPVVDQSGAMDESDSDGTEQASKYGFPERVLSLRGAKKSRSRTGNSVNVTSAPRVQMAILLSTDQVMDIFKRFKQVTGHPAGLQAMAKKFTAALSNFSKLRVLARMAYNDDQLAAVKEEDISEDVLNDQRRTLASLRQGIKTRMASGEAGREQLIIWDIETRVAVFMLVAAEESGGKLPKDFDQWTVDRPQSHRGTKRKRGDIYSAVSKALMSENPGYSSSFSVNNIKEMTNQGKLIYSLLKPYGRHWGIVLPLADFCREVDSSAHNNVLKVQPNDRGPQLHIEGNLRDPEAWKRRHSSDMADARAMYYEPGSDAAWGFGVDSGRRRCNWTAQPGDNGRLKIDHRDAVTVVRRLEPVGVLKLDYSITTWVTAMKLICNKQIGALRIKTTPDNQENEYWVFEWLDTCASTRDLGGEQKIANRQRWTDSDNVSVAIVEDTPGSCLALVVFEKGGKVNNVNTVHVLAHFGSIEMEYADRAKHWAAIISRLFPVDYPVLAVDVQMHSRVPGPNPASAKERLLHSGLMTVMDFVHLSIAGEQCPFNKRPDYDLCLRTLLSEVAGMAARVRRIKCGDQQWDAGQAQAGQAGEASGSGN